MGKPGEIELPGGQKMAILFEDRAVLAVDKPARWFLGPDEWHQTSRNLQLTLVALIRQGAFWAKSRNLKYLRFVHRLDADTTGVLLFAKSPGALRALSALFETRKVEKRYLAVVRGQPQQSQWTCRLKLSPDPAFPGRIRPDPVSGKAAETVFRVLSTQPGLALLEARPYTGRTHQLRVHLAASGYPVLGDVLYGPNESEQGGLALRSMGLSYTEPFGGRRIKVRAPTSAFLKRYGFPEIVHEDEV